MTVTQFYYSITNFIKNEVSFRNSEFYFCY